MKENRRAGLCPGHGKEGDGEESRTSMAVRQASGAGILEEVTSFEHYQPLRDPPCDYGLYTVVIERSL